METSAEELTFGKGVTAPLKTLGPMVHPHLGPLLTGQSCLPHIHR